MNETKALIYIVDDEPMLLELAGAILEMHGYETKRFRDPEAALGAYRVADPKPDVVMTDYAMHTMNGMDLIERCREVSPGQKILLVSGTVAEDVYEEATIKPDRFLAKPYQAKQLTDAIQDLLKKR